MKPLANEIAPICRDTQRELICSSFTFPRDGMCARAVISQTQAAFDLDTAEIVARQRAESLSPQAHADLLLVLALMKETQQAQPYALFDRVLISWNGILIFEIDLPHNRSGRCAYLSINDFRSRAVGYSTRVVTLRRTVLAAAVFTIAGAALFYLLHCSR